MNFFKPTFLITLLLISFSSIKAQNDLPKSVINIGPGVGQNYGIFGVKTVIGVKNSGLLIGLGSNPDAGLGYAIGGQISSQWFFMNLTYTTIGSYKVNNDPVKPIEAGNIMVGGMINVSGNKRTFIELSIGHSFAATQVDLGPFGKADQNGVTVGLGLQFRIGNSSE